MTDTNTISNLDNISSLAYNDLIAVDNANSLDIFGAPITENVSALQLFQYTTRAGGAASTLEDCVTATTGSLTVTYANGTAGVGATLTNAGTQEALSVDSRAMAVDERVLVWQQSTQFQNGVYTVTDIGSASTDWVLTRATDFDAAADMDLGTCVSILGGSTLLGSTFMMYTASAITVGTTSILWRLYSSVLLSSQNAMTVSGAGNWIVNISGLSTTTIPSGTKTLIGSGDNVTLGTITSDSHTFTTGTGLKTGTTVSDSYLISGYATGAASHKVFGTVTAGVVPTLVLSPQSGSLLNITKSVGTGGTNIIPSGSLFNNVTPVSNVGAGEDTLMTNDITADTFIVAGQYLEFEVAGTDANNINSKVIKVYFGSTVVATLTLVASLAGNWRCKTTITRTGTGTQAWNSEVTRTATGGATAIANTSGTCSETETATITMKCTGEAVADADVTQTRATLKSFAG